MGVRFVGVRKDWRGNITRFLTSTGHVVSVHHARVMALSGELALLSQNSEDGIDGMGYYSDSAYYQTQSNVHELPEF